MMLLPGFEVVVKVSFVPLEGLRQVALLFLFGGCRLLRLNFVLIFMPLS